MMTTKAGMATSMRRHFGYEERTAYLFIAPVMAVLGLVAVFPIAYSFYLSFFQIKLTRPNRTPFVWFDNYLELFGDQLFWTAVLRTVSFTVMSVTATTFLALLAALLLNETFRGRRDRKSVV